MVIYSLLKLFLTEIMYVSKLGISKPKNINSILSKVNCGVIIIYSFPNNIKSPIFVKDIDKKDPIIVPINIIINVNNLRIRFH